MKYEKSELAVKVLHWTVGLVILIESLIFALDPKEATHFARTGLPDLIRVFLAWSEIAASVLFLVPRTSVFGAWSLLVVFLAAAAIHVAHGQFNIGALLVYSAAVIVVMVHSGNNRPRINEPNV